MNIAVSIWLGLTVLFLIAEIATVGLVSLWFAAGSLCALIIAVLGGNMLVQTLIFLAVSGILLALLRPFTKKVLNPGITRTNVDAMVGTEGILTAAVDNLKGTGQVKLGAMEWTARSSDGTPIPAGTRVRVDRIQGVKAMVSPVTEEAIV